MHTCIPLHGLKRYQHSCSGQVNVGRNMHHPRRRNAVTSMVGLKNGDMRKNFTQNSEPQRYSWERRKEEEGCLRMDLIESWYCDRYY